MSQERGSGTRASLIWSGPGSPAQAWALPAPPVMSKHSWARGRLDLPSSIGRLSSSHHLANDIHVNASWQGKRSSDRKQNVAVASGAKMLLLHAGGQLVEHSAICQCCLPACWTSSLLFVHVYDGKQSSEFLFGPGFDLVIGSRCSLLY